MAVKAKKYYNKKASKNAQNKNAPKTTSGVVTQDKYAFDINDDGMTDSISNLFNGGKSSAELSKIVRSDNRELPPSNKNADNLYTQIYRSNGILLDHTQVKLYTKMYRYGINDPFNAVTTAREFLFFTKPDLHILLRDEPYNPYGDSVSNKKGGGINSYTGRPYNNILNYGLQGIPFWVDLFNKRKNTTIKMLQSSIDDTNPFNFLLQNMVKSNLEVPALDAESVDTPQNAFGVGYSYRGSSEASDDNPTFSLEFKDNKWLDVYYFFKAYEEYEKLKRHGVIRPYMDHIIYKVIHDAFSIYKFIVGEDMETILYFGKYYGVIPMSLPRDVFGDTNFSDGLSYSINFKAAFYEDMIPDIIADFNALTKKWYNKQKYTLSIHNNIIDAPDMRPATAAYVEQMTSTMSPTGYVYKLKWKGEDRV